MWDAWPIAVLIMTMLAAARAGWAALTLGQDHHAHHVRYAMMQAGGGAAMLAQAVFLTKQCREITGFGYWDMASLAWDDPYMRALPSVWIPPACWLVLVALGSWWVFAGIRAMGGPRDVTAVICALNEAGMMASLLLWKVYVPDTWPRAALFSFALKGLYLSCMTGAVVRVALGLLCLGTPAGRLKTSRSEHRVNSSLRRF